jgi:3-methyladenine DNA glycosylase AlkD
MPGWYDGGVTELAVEVVARLVGAFEPARDPVAAQPMVAYMRHQFEFLGLPRPARDALQRTAWAGLDRPDPPTLAAVARACWERPEREYQYAACDYLIRHRAAAAAESGFTEVVRELVTSKSWWDTVDALASRVAGPLVARHPALVVTMRAWGDDPNFWVARTALLHQLHYRERTDAALLFELCERRAADREFFIRKAIGWALREYSKTDADAVRGFVCDHAEVLSGLSQKEALKWLERRAKR